MSFKIFNTMSGKKEDFISQKENHVGMYVCGVTVYDYCHVGHARAAIAFDTLYRYLQYLGNKVYYIRNFTDIDDKIINRANEESCLLYTSPSPRDGLLSRMPSSA